MNGELATRLGHGLDAAVWSSVPGLAALTLVLAFSPRMRQGFGSLRKGLRGHEIRWWQCIGGVIGGLFVFTQAYAVPIAGVALFTIAVVGAQTLTAVGVDKLGIGPAGRVPVTVARVAAALLAIVGRGRRGRRPRIREHAPRSSSPRSSPPWSAPRRPFSRASTGG